MMKNGSIEEQIKMQKEQITCERKSADMQISLNVDNHIKKDNSIEPSNKQKR